MPKYKKDRCGYIFNHKNQLMFVTGDYDNLKDIICRIQLFLLELDMDFGS